VGLPVRRREPADQDALSATGARHQHPSDHLDYTGRRAKKEVQTWDDQAQAFVTETRKFLYDGWLLVAELKDVSGTPCLDRALAWGPDLSGTLEGAGGIGGLVSVTQYGDNITTYLPAYDGNGNVMAMVRADTGSVEARYDYSPYGQTLTSTGSYAVSNPFRFSTKYNDSETGLLYFGYRYYNSEMGRWVTRDPIGELGGRNVYAFISNNILSKYDLLGLADCKCGDKTEPECNAVVLNNGETPTQKMEQDQLIEAAGGLENLNTLISLIQGRLALNMSIEAATEWALDQLVEQGVTLTLGERNILKLALKAVDFYMDQTAGFNVWTRIQHKECRRFWYFWRRWVDVYDTDWVKHQEAWVICPHFMYQLQ
jgi:RHS repeat-associated protein